MFTRKQIELYVGFGGDIEGWVRAGGQGMSDAQWHQLDELVQKLHLVIGGLASASMCSQVQEQIDATVVNREAQDLLVNYVQQCA